MQIDAVVVNASPLITLFRSGQADLLPRMFKRVVVPEAVWQEVVSDEWDDTAAQQLSKQTWPVRENVVLSPRVAAWRPRSRRDGGIEPCIGKPTATCRNR
ncbi:MAG: hypothetical protein ACKVQA_12915 [Burkholderiales bacterium]